MEQTQEKVCKLKDQDLDGDGFLADMATWTRAAAEELGRRNDIPPLTDDHWKILQFVREYYLEHHVGPPVVKISKATGLTNQQICDLFPCGVARGAYRLAGLPRPSGCL
ncbi:TusE/DsrC/DsvC family sulfur relay protein [Planctomycetota bacterium]